MASVTRKIMLRIGRALLGTLAMALAAGGAILLTGGPRSLAPFLVMGVALVPVAYALRGRFRWDRVDFIVPLLVANVVALRVISLSATGYWTFAFDPEHLPVLAWVNIFLALPWCAGVCAGSARLRRAAEQEGRPLSSEAAASDEESS